MSDDEKTVRDFYYPPADKARGIGEVTARWAEVSGALRRETFTELFRIGRSEACEVRLQDERISKVHAQVFHDGKRWCVVDLGSTHGTYLNGVLINQAPLTAISRLQFRVGGPFVELQVEGGLQSEVVQPRSVTNVVNHYFGKNQQEPPGEHTLMIRTAYERVRRMQARRYWWAIGVIAALALAALIYAGYQKIRLDRARELYIGIFYQMADMRLQIAKVSKEIASTGNPEYIEEMGARKERLRLLEEQYDAFLEEHDFFTGGAAAADRIILRMARLFGECELNTPAGFVDEVKKYIDRWKSTTRLARAVGRLRPDHHLPLIYQAFLAHNLPPQFLYLALQESDFDERAVGPRTRFGIAKGPWQFIPETALRYGLRTGPLLEMPVYDPADQRFDFEASTRAAAQFIRDLYDTDAQSSGLLVMASYNWGPGNIRRLIRQMPENPRDRNFWKLLEKHRIPEQTYDYVYYIFSAAVIGENPALFGFDFANPLDDLNLVQAAPETVVGEPGGGVVPVDGGVDAAELDGGVQEIAPVKKRRPRRRRPPLDAGGGAAAQAPSPEQTPAPEPAPRRPINAAGEPAPE